MFFQLARDLPRDDFARIIRTFEADVRHCLGSLQQAAERGDFEGYARVAHSLAGAAAVIGAEPLERSVRNALEEAETRASPDSLVAALQSVTHEAVYTLAALSEIAARQR